MFNINTKILADRSYTYPKDNVYFIREGNEDMLVIELALAGFSPEEIAVHSGTGIVKVQGKKHEETQLEKRYIVRNIAQREFNISYPVGNYNKVSSVNMVDGLLQICLLSDLQPVTIAKVPINDSLLTHEAA
jgi:molecular chaperone IbpA